MNLGYQRWKTNLQLRAREAETAAAASAAAAAQSTANTGVADAATAQADVDALAVTVETVQASADAQTEALAAAAAVCNTPGYYTAPAPYVVGFYCTTSGAAIRYRINGGSWSSYSTPVTLTGGQYIEAQGQAGGLADSGLLRYPTTGTV